MEQSKRTVTIKKAPSLLMLLGLMLATLLTAAAPAFAQEEIEIPDGPEVKPPVTGVLKDTGLGGQPLTKAPGSPRYEGPVYGLIDESSGTALILKSDVYDLSDYLGERVTADGTLAPEPDTPDPFLVLDVTSLEPAGPPETATVTFQLTIDGVVPEGRTFGLGYQPIGYLLEDFQSVAFCTTDTTPEPAPQGAPDLLDESTLPVCEDGGTYTDTLEVPLGEPFSFDYLLVADRDVVRCEPGRMGPLEVFYSDERTFTEDATVSVTYTEDGLPPGCRAVGEGDGGSGNGGEGSGDSNGGEVSGDSNGGEVSGDSNGSISDNDSEGSGSISSGSTGVSSGDVGKAGSEPSGGSPSGGAASTSGAKTLPATGGTLAIVLGAGALLLSGGLLVRRFAK